MIETMTKLNSQLQLSKSQLFTITSNNTDYHVRWAVNVLALLGWQRSIWHRHNRSYWRRSTLGIQSMSVLVTLPPITNAKTFKVKTLLCHIYTKSYFRDTCLSIVRCMREQRKDSPAVLNFWWSCCWAVCARLLIAVSNVSNLGVNALSSPLNSYRKLLLGRIYCFSLWNRGPMPWKCIDCIVINLLMTRNSNGVVSGL